MLKKVVEYTDWDGNPQKAELHFHLTKAELLEFVSQYPDDFTAYVKKIASADNKAEIIAMFRSIVLKSYGKRDGASFTKSVEMAEAFSHTEAYSNLFLELFNDTEAMIRFFNAVMGVDLQKLAAENNVKLN